MPGHRYQELKDFMVESKKRWASLYPGFRSHGDGDKLEAYKLVKSFVDPPQRYKKLSSVWALTSDIINDIEADAFVIKAILGNQGRRVICLHRIKVDLGRNGTFWMYKDILRHRDYDMNLGQTLSYIIHTLKRDEESKGSALIIEEFVGNPSRGLPQDYKLYTVNGQVRLISVFGRRGRDEYANCYDRNWHPIPLTRIYKQPEALDYIENQVPIDGLPNAELRQELIKLAEQLAREHKALFCRYDFYCENNKIYFGEITPVCGDLNNYRVNEDFAKGLIYRKQIAANLISTSASISTSNTTSSTSSSSDKKYKQLKKYEEYRDHRKTRVTCKCEEKNVTKDHRSKPVASSEPLGSLLPSVRPVSRRIRIAPIINVDTDPSREPRHPKPSKEVRKIRKKSKEG